MKRLISVMMVVGSILLFLGCQDSVTDPSANQSDQALSIASADMKPAPSLNMNIDYVFVGHLRIFDAEGRRLIWEAEAHGDVEGTMKWWFVPGGGPPNMPDEAHTSFYEGRWEIWNAGGDVLLLAGVSSGVTAMPKDKDGIWNGNGMVTETSPEYEVWNGRRIKEAGKVNFVFPYSGEGTFRIN